MNAQGFALFPTRIGQCALAWSEAGVCGVWFPEASEAATRARIRRRLGDVVETDPPPAMRLAMARIAGLLESGREALADLALDLSAAPETDWPFLEAARTIPAGQTITYGELAARAGRAGAAREAGGAMARNPVPIVVPCHRVMAAGGGFGGFSAPGGLEAKARLLNIEHAAISAAPLLFDALPIAPPPKRK